MKKVTLIRPDPEKLRNRRVTLDVDRCVELLRHELTFDGKLLDRYEIAGADEKKAVVSVFQRYYLRAGNALILTVTVDDLAGSTRVHWISGGGADSVLTDVDGGAANAFESDVSRILKPYELKEAKED